MVIFENKYGIVHDNEIIKNMDFPKILRVCFSHDFELLKVHSLVHVMMDTLELAKHVLIKMNVLL